MGKASRRKRDQGGRSVSSGHLSVVPDVGRAGDVRAGAEAALERLVRVNEPGKVSLAGAYALGYCDLAVAQHDGDGPSWFGELDPLETLILGTVWPQRYRDSFEFANSCAAWLRLMRRTAFWPGIKRFCGEALALSEELDLPVDDGELMLLLAGRLEAAGLDQRLLPRELLPDEALDGARFIDGPAGDLVLPDPPPDAAGRVARFRAACEVDLPGDGTAAGALRDGLRRLAGVGVYVHGDAGVLLAAMYLGLVAPADEGLAEAGQRCVAWALGLEDVSPLVPVADVLLVTAQRELDADVALGHLFAVGAFTQQVRPQDREWHGSPGGALVRLAFELGHRQVITRKAKRVRLDGPGWQAMVETQNRRFAEKFGRPMGPDDLVFFDPDADEPQPAALLDMGKGSVAMLEAAGISPAWIYATQHTGGLLPRPDGSFERESDRANWSEAVDRYLKLHQPEERVDHDAEMGKLRNVLVGLMFGRFADDPEYFAVLLRRMGTPSEPPGDDDSLIGEYLQACTDDLMDTLQNDPAIASAACEFARAWAGASLSDRVRKAASAPEAEDVGYDVLLAVAAAVGAK